MRWIAATCLCLVTAAPLKAFEPTHLTCSMLPQCTFNVNCEIMLVLNMDVEKTDTDWTATIWYADAKSVSYTLNFQEMQVPETQHSDLFLQSAKEFGGGIFVNILSIHEDGGASLNTITGGDISGNTPYIGDCEKVI